MRRTQQKPPANRTPGGDAQRWAAVLNRDDTRGERFVYSVATTGIYCRPSCPARRPRRENVRFHASAAEAEAAGFRPCKRCKPDAESLRTEHAGKIARACRLIEGQTPAPSLAVLAATVGMSPYHFHRVFKAITGVTPKAYAVAKRGERMPAVLKGSETVTDAIYATGFGSSGRFYAQAGKALGMAPGAFRNGGEGVELKHTVGTCSLGLVLVAESAKGIAAILIGDDEKALKRDLAARFPKATLTAGGRDFARRVRKVVAFVDAPHTVLELPLDVAGTAFQHRVWQALREIPAGSTATYAEIAERIGQPSAARAVAGACAANPLAVAVPCHRVVRNDGTLSGYRWGIARKRALLDKERRGPGTGPKAK